MLVLFFACKSCGQKPGGPKLPGDVKQIGGTGEFQHHEGFLKGLCDEGKTEDDRRQIDHISQHQTKPHEEGLAETRTQRARNDRRHSRAWNGCSDEQGHGIGKDGGDGHGHVPLVSPSRHTPEFAASQRRDD